MHSGLGSRVGGGGKGGEGFTGGRQGARLGDGELELLRHIVYREIEVSERSERYYMFWITTKMVVAVPSGLKLGAR